VNIPEHITLENESSIRFDSNADQPRREAEKLAIYLWENYIEPYDHEQVFFIGIGNAFHGVVKLLTEKGLYILIPKQFYEVRLTHSQKRYTKELAALWLSSEIILSDRFTAPTTRTFRGGTLPIRSSLFHTRIVCGTVIGRPPNGMASCRNRPRNNFTI
jgi:hypothetical protein